MKHIIWTIFAAFLFLDSQSQDLLPFKEGKLWGYTDKQGNIRISPQYQYAQKFHAAVAIVAHNDSLGAIDEHNNLIIPFKYQYLRLLDSSEFLFGHRAVYFGEYDIGVMTWDQKVKIAPEYRNISKLKGLYIVTKQEDSILKKNPAGDLRTLKFSYGLLDSNGKVLIPCKYDYLDWRNDSLVVLIINDNGKGRSALFNTRGEQLTGFDYMVFGKFIEGVAKARIDDKFGFIYPTGKIAIPVIYDYCEDFNKGYAIIKQNDKWGAIDRLGKIVIEPKLEYQDVKSLLKEKVDAEISEQIGQSPGLMFQDSFPQPSGYINDYENVYTHAERKSLDSLIDDFEKRTTIEFAVITFDTSMVSADELDALTLRIAKAWGVGKKIENNGVVIGLSTGHRRIRIHNGYGIEKILTDEETKAIMDSVIIPAFREGEYFEGTFNGLVTLMKTLEGRYKKRKQ